MTIMRKVAPIQVSETAANRSKFVAATSQLARDGHVLEPAGMDVDNFLRSGTIFFDHNPQQPVARPVSAALNADGNLEIEVEWPPEGVSARADEVRGLVKAGVLRAGSVGFDPVEFEPLNPKKPGGGLHITRSELLEFSIVGVPADTGAVVTQRSDKTAEWKCGASRDLPIEDSDSWDGAAAEASVFEWAGGDDFDPSKARKAFLAYDAAAPKKRGSYKLPIAHVVDGRLKVPKGAIRAAASRLPNTDIPESVKETAQGVIDHYEEKAGMGEKGDRALRLKHTRALERAPRLPVFKRGLCEVAALAWTLEQLGYAQACAEWEADVEGDESAVPAMLAESLKSVAAALVAMTEEEVAEFLARLPDDGEEEGEAETIEHGLSESDRAYIAAGATPRARAWRRGIAIARAGKVLSAANEKLLARALKHQTRAAKHHESVGDAHEELGGALETARAAHEKAHGATEQLGEAIEAAQSEPAKASEHLKRAAKLHGTILGHQQDVDQAHEDAEDAQEDATDAHAAVGRCMDGVARCVRAVVDGSTPGDPEGDSKLVQTSASIADSSGSENGRARLDYKSRRTELARLAAVP
jgi:HK97 family phage prohead protease